MGGFTSDVHLGNMFILDPCVEDLSGFPPIAMVTLLHTYATFTPMCRRSLSCSDVGANHTLLLTHVFCPLFIVSNTALLPNCFNTAKHPHQWDQFLCGKNRLVPTSNTQWRLSSGTPWGLVWRHSGIPTQSVHWQAFGPSASHLYADLKIPPDDKLQLGVRRLWGRRCIPLGTHWMPSQIPVYIIVYIILV